MAANVFDVAWDGPKPPNYSAVFAWRSRQLVAMQNNPSIALGAIEYYRNRPVEFIEHWLSTFDPRLAGSDRPSTMPFVLFKRQKEFIRWLHQLLILQKTNGLVEKARDVGATWLCAAFSVWAWRFIPGAAIGWGSRKEELVDKIGDPSSIFEKMRIMIRSLPRLFWPSNFKAIDDMPFRRILNRETGASIVGEAGNNIGRGGRNLIYFVDEAAHLENPEMVEASLSETTRVRVDISSVNGPNNVFHRKRKAGREWAPLGLMDTSRTSVFIFDWRDHPEKTPEWYAAKKAEWEEKGLPHIFAQEVDRSYTASVAGVIIRPEWVQAAFGAADALGFDDEGLWIAGLDVADEGGDKNALTIRKGPCLKHATAWGEGDTGATARRAVVAIRDIVQGASIGLQYDSVGIGAGIKAEMNRLRDDHLLPAGLKFVPWNAGASVLRPDQNLIRGDKGSPLNKDIFSNLKAQAWFEVARRFERTYKARIMLEATKDADGVWKVYDPADLISIDANHPNRYQLENELSQAVWKDLTSSMKMSVNKSPSGADSPNLADSLVMAYFPVNTGVALYTAGSIG